MSQSSSEENKNKEEAPSQNHALEENNSSDGDLYSDVPLLGETVANDLTIEETEDLPPGDNTMDAIESEDGVSEMDIDLGYAGTITSIADEELGEAAQYIKHHLESQHVAASTEADDEEAELDHGSDYLSEEYALETEQEDHPEEDLQEIDYLNTEAPNVQDDQDIATLEAIVFESDHATAPAPQDLKDALVTKRKNPEQEHDDEESTQSTDASLAQPPNNAAALAPAQPNLPPKIEQPAAQLQASTTKGENPFLPKHILDRLNQGKRNLVEEIAQSGAALDASTALLRAKARAERPRAGQNTQHEQRHSYGSGKMKAEQQKQQLIDDLVEDYLPLIAAELRRRLKRMLD